MTYEQWTNEGAVMICRRCQRPGLLGEVRDGVPPPHFARIECQQCGTFYDWLRAPKNEDRRKRTPATERERIWQEYGGHCAHCGQPAEFFDSQRIERTVQHVPPHCVAGDGARLIPYCGPCNAHSEWMRRNWTRLREAIESLVARVGHDF